MKMVLATDVFILFVRRLIASEVAMKVELMG